MKKEIGNTADSVIVRMNKNVRGSQKAGEVEGKKKSILPPVHNLFVRTDLLGVHLPGQARIIRAEMAKL